LIDPASFGTEEIDHSLTTAAFRNIETHSPLIVTPVASPLPFALLLPCAPFSLLLEAQPPEIDDQPNRKRGHTIEEDISKANKHSPMH
jgi:hypothetical protein